MGLISKFKRKFADVRRLEEAHYAQALAELNAGTIRPGLYAKAMAEAQGNEDKAAAIYLRLRVQALQDELIDRPTGSSTESWPIDTPGRTDSSGHDSSPPSASGGGGAASASINSRMPTPDDPSAKSQTPWGLILLGLVSLGMVGAYVALELSSHDRSSTTSRTLSAAPSTPTASRRASGLYLLPDNTTEIQTQAGTLKVVKAAEPDELRLNGLLLETPGADYLSLLSISRHDTEDLILVARNCGGTACTFTDLSLVRVSAWGPAKVETDGAFRFGSDIHDRLQAGISLEGELTRVDLGLEAGQVVWAEFGPGRAPQVKRRPAAITALGAEACADIHELLAHCAEFDPPCDGLAFSDCEGMSMAFLRAFNYYRNQTTGLNAPRFTEACVEASWTGQVPDYEAVRSAICSGADPAQWSR